MPKYKLDSKSNTYSLKKIPLTISLNPTQLTDDNAKLLHQFLLSDERAYKTTKVKIFEPNKKYYFKNICLQFTLTLVRETINIPEIHHKEYSYIVYSDSESNVLGEGNFGCIYMVYGKLKHSFVDNKVIYSNIIGKKNRTKHRVIKKQIVDKKKPGEYANRITIMKIENQISQLAIHTKTKKITFQKNKYGSKIASYMVMRAFYGSTLNKVIHNNMVSTIEEYLDLSINLIRALAEQIHAANIVHRDIKPTNIFVDVQTMEVNILDFGLSRIKEDGKLCGTKFWLSPEALTKKTMDKKCDVYAIGRVLKMLWKDNVIQDENKLPSEIIVELRRNEYNDPTIVKPTNFSKYITKSLKKYLYRHPLDNIKNPQHFAKILDKLTAPLPKNRISLLNVLILLQRMRSQHNYSSEISEISENGETKNAIIAAVNLKLVLAEIKFKGISNESKLNYVSCVMNNTIDKLPNSEIAIHTFIHTLNINALNKCHTKEEIKHETHKIIEKTRDTLKKRENLRLVILQEKKLLAATKNRTERNTIRRQLTDQISLFKKKVIVDLDDMCLLNKKYNDYSEKTINQSFFVRYIKKILLTSIVTALAGCAVGVGLGVGCGVLGTIPTGGVSLLLTPFSVLFLGGLGLLTGSLVGLLIGIVDSLCVERISKQSAKQSVLHEDIISENNRQHLVYHSFKDDKSLITVSPTISLPPKENICTIDSVQQKSLKHHSLFMANCKDKNNLQKVTVSAPSINLSALRSNRKM